MTALVDNRRDCEPADTRARALLMSIRPKHVNAILDGTKTVELRRTRPNVPLGSVVFLYSSSPVKAIVGWACLADLVEGTPDDVREAHQAAAAVSDEVFVDYFRGATTAVGLLLHRVVQASTPISLEELRELGVEPPQSWRYVDPEVTDRIRRR